MFQNHTKKYFIIKEAIEIYFHLVMELLENILKINCFSIF